MHQITVSIPITPSVPITPKTSPLPPVALHHSPGLYYSALELSPCQGNRILFTSYLCPKNLTSHYEQLLSPYLTSLVTTRFPIISFIIVLSLLFELASSAIEQCFAKKTSKCFTVCQLYCHVMNAFRLTTKDWWPGNRLVDSVQ